MEITTKVAIQIAAKAGELLKQNFFGKRKETVKTVGPNIVTDADILSEKMILKEIWYKFPTHAILSEETSPTTNPQKYNHLWVIDPLDGTISYASGLPFYSVSIAYMHEQQVKSAALYLGVSEEIIWAEKGSGAFIGKRRHIVKPLPIEKSIIALDPGIKKRKLFMEKVAPLLSKHIRFLLMTPGEAANLGFLAKGSIQGVVCASPDIWDCIAGLFIVQQANGFVSDLSGKPYTLLSNLGHIATASKTLQKEITRYTQSLQ